jgi:hypothetical protein
VGQKNKDRGGDRGEKKVISRLESYKDKATFLQKLKILRLFLIFLHQAMTS